MLGSNGELPPTMADVRPFYQAHFRYLEGSERQIDHPSPIQGAWKVDAIGLPRETLDALYQGNAARLFGLRGLTGWPPPAAPAPPLPAAAR
jgi:hypothetical protein